MSMIKKMNIQIKNKNTINWSNQIKLRIIIKFKNKILLNNFNN